MLYEKAELNPANLNEGHIGFQIGPRLNAVGRLADANPMVDFLTTTDPSGHGPWSTKSRP
jgi:single-stranded-DNA-specific exonuclease